MPDGHPVKEEARPWIILVDQIAYDARRCRIANRAYGMHWGPDEIAAHIPLETLDILELLDE